MLKNIALFFIISFFLGHPSVAGGRFSKKTEVNKLWIGIKKPTDAGWQLWESLARAYSIEANYYENDIEFVLPKRWQYVLSKDGKFHSVKNERGVVLINIFPSKDAGGSRAFFIERNIKGLQGF